MYTNVDFVYNVKYLMMMMLISIFVIIMLNNHSEAIMSSVGTLICNNQFTPALAECFLLMTHLCRAFSLVARRGGPPTSAPSEGT